MTTTKQKGRDSGKCATPTTSQNDTSLALVQGKDEPRIDSRLLAQHLGNKHKNVRELIEQHRQRFERINQLRFQTEVGKRRQGGGNPERYALLTEDQAYYLLSLSKNTERVADLKLRLVLAFREARQAQDLTKTEYLPTYHALHDEISSLAGQSPNERFVHINVNRLINRAVGIDAGQRPRLGLPQRSLLVAAQFLAGNAMHGATDHKDGYARAKAVLERLGGQLLGGGHA